jgi:hypothetical protein
MSLLSQQRCLNHGTREAVARCPECRFYFCRECITEHDDRLICASCLKKITRAPEKKTWRLGGLIRVGQAVFGVFTVWLFFYLAGQGMLSFETYFHDQTLWKNTQSDREE